MAAAEEQDSKQENNEEEHHSDAGEEENALVDGQLPTSEQQKEQEPRTELGLQIQPDKKIGEPNMNIPTIDEEVKFNDLFFKECPPYSLLSSEKMQMQSH